MFRLIPIFLIVLTVIYVCLSLYSRAKARDRLEAQWAEDLRVGDREAFVREGMDSYQNSLRRKLIWGVYVVPILAVVGLIYVQNFM
ncbi:MAG: hypothetical protein AAGD04_11565 [Pseudomonadota bacterium]